MPSHHDLSAQEFRAAAERALEWVLNYIDSAGSTPVLPHVAPGDTARRLPAHAPEHAEGMSEILDDFERVIVPGLTQWNHPGFLAYFAASSAAPGIIAELLAAAVNNNAMLWRTGPSATELEQQTLGWLRDAMALPRDWFGVINDTASISSLLALAAAREDVCKMDIRELGLSGRPELPTLRVYASEHCHSSIDKAAITLGFGHRNVVHIPVDEMFRMRPDALARAIAADRDNGHLPVAVVATVGTTSTSSVDPVSEIADICEREQLWLHVDAAYAGVTALLPEKREHFRGVERADSLVVNPHKWLFVPVDLSVLYTRKPEVLKRAFSLVPEYLITKEQDEVVNLMDYGVQLGRRFRSLKLWFTMRAFGLEGLRARLRHHIEIAQTFAGWVQSDHHWRVEAPHPFSLICFRYAPPHLSPEAQDDANTRILELVNRSGDVFLSHTKLHGRVVLRLAIGNIRTDRSHLERAWQLLRAAPANLT